MSDFKNYQWRKMAKNGEKWRKMAMANLPFSFVKFAISPLAPPPPHKDTAHHVTNQRSRVDLLGIQLILNKKILGSLEKARCGFKVMRS